MVVATAITGGGGGGLIFTYIPALHNQFLLRSTILMVCEHEYINI